MSAISYPLGSQQLKTGSQGFTLLEILVVMALLSLIVSMLPSGLTALNSRANQQMLVQKVVVAARQCSITAQQQQRSIGLGSEACPLPADTERLTVNAESLPLFHADGTASRTTRIVIEMADGSDHPATVVMIDSLTANVSSHLNAQN